ncbi:MAG: M6 family metalloprotease domain-containing protein [Bacteroidales bacterium]|jgi:M6 family metalloprotease-like protein|nr:M6 family metalloprotease domain-containing protein [Bacteroidales bacterium]
MCNIFGKFSCLLVCLLIISIKTFAVIAYPYPIDVKQSDGTTLKVQLKGDEKVNWAKTMDNYTLLRNKIGDFVYAISDKNGGIDVSDVIAHNPDERSKEELDFLSHIEKSLFFSAEQISLKKQVWNIQEDFNRLKNKNLKLLDSVEHYKMIVILMGYQDKAFTTPKQNIIDLFNQVGYSANGHQGSVHDYFDASSFGKLDVEATVVGPFTSAYNMTYYASNAQALIIEAVNAANPYINYAEYTNGDGNYVSCVYVIYAGFAASDAAYGTIWPHRSWISPYFVDGVYVRDYACSSEKGNYANANEPLTIGTICHEFGHVLGLPDMYYTDYSPDSWDIMAAGNYNNGSRTPPLWNAYERSTRGYIDFDTFNFNGSITLPPLSSTNKAFIAKKNNTEYFIFENRQKENFDWALPGHGLLIWKINYTYSWILNGHPLGHDYDLIEANGEYQSRAADPFPGTYNHTSFTPTSVPNSNWQDGTSSGISLTDIMENTQTSNIIFNYNFNYAGYPTVVTQGINYVNSDSINVAASVVNNVLTVTEKGVCYSTSSTPNISSKVVYSGVNTAFNVDITGLQPSTTYYVRAYAKVNTQVVYGETMKVITPCRVETLYPLTISFEDEENRDCITMESKRFLFNSWRYVDSVVIDENTNIIANEGNKFAFVKNETSDIIGQDIKLLLPPVDISVLSQPVLKFDHIQRSKDGNQDNLKVYYKANLSDSWSLLATYTQHTTNWTEKSINLPNKSTNYYIAFEALLKGGYGECVDNIRIIDDDLTAYPVVQTNTYTELMDISFKVSGNVVSNGNTPLIEKGICYGTSPNPTIIADKKVTTTGTLGSFDLLLNNLTPSTVYYVRAYARNSGLVSYGQDIIVTTRCQRVEDFPYSPSITSNDTLCIEKEQGWTIDNGAYKFSAFSGVSAKLLLPIFNLQNRGSNKLKFSYRQPDNAGAIDTLKIYNKVGISSSWQLLKTFNTATSQWVEDSVNLSAAADNYFIAFEGVAANGYNIYIKDVNIQSILLIPIVTTLSPTLATYNSISTGGDVVYEGVTDVTARGICYATYSLPTISDTKVNSGDGLGNYNLTISNLQPLTTYYIRAFAQNSYGTSYGQEYIMTTLPVPVENNIISCSRTESCSGYALGQIMGSLPSGGTGTFEYSWQTKINDGEWESPGTNNMEHYQHYDAGIVQTPDTNIYIKSFRRIVTSGFASDTSNVITITIYPATRGGNVFIVRNKDIRDTLELGDTIAMELRVNIGNVLYWQRHKEGYHWQNLDNTSGLVLIKDCPQETGHWYYRAVVQSGICNVDTSGSNDVYIKNKVGLDNIHLDNTLLINITPNPSNGELQININKSELVDISLTTFLGQLVIEKKSFMLKQGANDFDVKNLKNGHYILRISNKNFNWQDTLIIIK